MHAFRSVCFLTLAMPLVPRLPAVGQLPDTPGLVEKILAIGPTVGGAPKSR